MLYRFASILFTLALVAFGYQINKGITFKPVTNTFDNQGLVLPEGAKYDLLFAERTDSVVTADGKKYPAKGKQDFLAYLPINGSSEHGYLYVNHESRLANDDLGDGGGMTWFEVKKENNRLGSKNVVQRFCNYLLKCKEVQADLRMFG
jgi:secreted PhoX family phosphatase